MTVIPLHYANVIHSFGIVGDPEPYAVTYGVEVMDPPASAEVNDLAAALHGLLDTHLMPILPQLLILQQTEIYWQATAPPDAPQVGSFAQPEAGGNAQPNLLPQNCAWLVHKRTAIAGRRGRGRMYFPGIGEGQADNVGQVLAASITQWNTALEAWRAGIVANANFVGMVVLHSDSVNSPTPPPTLVQSLNLDSLIATQRRRLRK